MNITTTPVERHENQGHVTYGVTVTANKTSASITLSVRPEGQIWGTEVGVCCLNASHRVGRGLGRHFADFAAAAESYKSTAMKLAIAEAERAIGEAVEGDARPTVADDDARLAGLSRADLEFGEPEAADVLRVRTLDDELFSRADYFNSHSDRTDENREEYATAADRVMAIYGVTQGDLDRFAQLWAAWLGARGRCASAAVTGPSNFPAHKAAKANHSERKRREDVDAFVARLRKRAKRQKKADDIEAAGGEAAVARTEIERDQRLLDQMKAANKIVRAKPRNEATPAKLAKLAELGLDGQRAESLFEPDMCGRYGFPGFELESVRNGIKRRKEKLEALAKLDAVAGIEDDEIALDGVTVTLAWADDRIQVRHDVKPSDEVRRTLRRRGGLIWAPSATAWQRKLTSGGSLNWRAVIAVEQVLGVDLQSHPVIRAAAERMS